MISFCGGDLDGDTLGDLLGGFDGLVGLFEGEVDGATVGDFVVGADVGNLVVGTNVGDFVVGADVGNLVMGAADSDDLVTGAYEYESSADTGEAVLARLAALFDFEAMGCEVALDSFLADLGDWAKVDPAKMTAPVKRGVENFMIFVSTKYIQIDISREACRHYINGHWA